MHSWASALQIAMSRWRIPTGALGLALSGWRSRALQLTLSGMHSWASALQLPLSPWCSPAGALRLTLSGFSDWRSWIGTLQLTLSCSRSRAWRSQARTLSLAFSSWRSQAGTVGLMLVGYRSCGDALGLTLSRMTYAFWAIALESRNILRLMLLG